MKKTFALILILCLTLAAAAIAEDAPFFDPQKGFAFTAPHDHDPIGFVNICDHPDATGVEVEGRQSAPSITRSAPDAAGNVTYTVSYQSSGNYTFLVRDPEDFAWWDSAYFALEDYRPFDFTTGTNLCPSDEIIADKGVLQKETTVQLPDRAVKVSVTMSSVVGGGAESAAPQGDRWLYECPMTVDTVITIVAPADYDGLVLAIRVNGVSPEHTYDAWTVWDDFGNLQDWEFIRVSDNCVYETLQKGSRGDGAKALQQRLADLGYLTGTVDGDFGPGTEKAVMAFQQAAGLEPTGIADGETQKALFAEDAPRAAQ